MNIASASRTEQADHVGAPSGTGARTRVWDLPVRVFHWLMVASFAGAWLTAESERWRLLHVSLGYTMAVLVGFRILWGVVGTRHARFANFVRGPREVVRYLRSLLTRNPEHHVGHNPAGAWAILGLLGLTVTVVASGWSALQDLGGHRLEELHEAAAHAMLVLVLVHIAGVVVSSVLHGENLVRPMFTGFKSADPGQGIASARRGVAALILAAVTAVFYLNWSSGPPLSANAAKPAGREMHHADDDD